MKNNKIFLFGPFQLDLSRGTLRRNDELVNLPPKVFETLCLLAEQRGDVVSKRAMMDHLWPDAYVEESNVTQNIFLLRKILGKSDAGADYVETLSKRGYRLSVPVEELVETPEEHEVSIVVPVAGSPEISHNGFKASSLLEVLPSPVEESLASLSHPGAQRRLGRIGLAAMVLLFAGFVVAEFMGWPESQHPSVLRYVRLTNDGAYKEHLTAVLSDGSRLYFSETLDAQVYLAQTSVTGGETTRQRVPFPGASAFSYSKARNEMLFGALWETGQERPLTVMSMPEGSAHPVGDFSAHAASWSPDGSLIVYARGGSLFISSADGSGVREIARMKGVPYWPRWSPDGTRVRFSQSASGEGLTLWEIRADGQGLHRLFGKEPWGEEACCGDWSPDGRYYVFVVDDNRQSSLWVTPEMRKWWAVQKPMQLAEGPVDFWRSPLVAPDSKHIFALGEQARGELMKYDPGTREFRPYLNGLSTDTVSFSRDHQWIAYTAYPEGSLWRSRPDGSERLRLTNNTEVARFPQWSPDGSTILYIAQESGKAWKIMAVPSKGGRSDTVLPGADNQGVATWSPDGSRIAFGELVAFGVNQQHEQVIRILEVKQHTATILPGSNGLWTARWSPDGRYLSAVTVDNRKLKLYDFQTQQWSELADVGTNDVVWSHDGKTIYFDCTDEPVVYRFDVKSRHLEKFISLKGMRRTGFFGWSLNISADDTPVLLREAGIHEVYSLQVNLP